MRKPIGLLLLLTLWVKSSHEVMSQEKLNEEESLRVLIRTKRRWVLSTIELEEEDPGPFPRKISELHNDKHLNHSIKFKISGQGVTEHPIGVLSINEKTGEVFVHKSIDREVYPEFMVNFDVMDERTNTAVDKTLAFNVDIKDKNDNPPLFTPTNLNTQISENLKEGHLPFSLQAKDMDEKFTDNSRISMEIVSQEPPLPKISLQPISGGTVSMVARLTLTGCFDYDKVNNYKVLVKAWDHGTPSLSSTTTVNITITDSNTHPPVFTATKFNAEVIEMQTNKEILRIPVEDQDLPNTTASRAVFTILKGNEEEQFKIETDPFTNEGVLTVIKGKNYEKSDLTELEIGVGNEEPLFVCVDGKPGSPVLKILNANNRVKVAVKVINVNDPPIFKNRIKTMYRVEEEEPGGVLYIPTITDEDSDLNKMRFELLQDPAKWMSIDPKTGKITLAKKMDRESPYVYNSTYTVTMRVIDDGNPPGTGTGTLVVHLGDKNDNVPRLTSNTSVICGNKDDRVKIKATDADAFPYGEPFTFTFNTDDQEVKRFWKLAQPTGSEILLINGESAPYGNYSIPLKITDQQGMQSHNVLQVVVCDCGKGNVCQDLLPRSSNLHGAAIAVLISALVIVALLLSLCLTCKCQEKNNFKQCLEEDGIQTLIAYNEEGKGSVCQSPVGSYTGLKSDPIQFQHSTTNHFGSSNLGTFQATNGVGDTTDLRHISTKAKSATWTANKSSIYKNAKTRFTRSFSLVSNWDVEEHLQWKLNKISSAQQDFGDYNPHDYSSEGTNTSTMSLDKLSIDDTGNNLDFLQNLGPKFCNLDEIIQQGLQEKNIVL